MHQASANTPTDLIAPQVYAKWRASDLGRITDAVEADLIETQLGEVRGRSVLDIGCGDGLLAVRLARRGASVVAIDNSPHMISAASQRARQTQTDVDFALGSAQALPFADNSFDIVSAITILCFVANPSPVFAEVARVLRPGGCFVIGELGRFSTWAVRRRVKGWLGSQLWRHAYFRTPAELVRLCREAGLNPTAVKGAVYYPHSNLAARHMARFDAQLSRKTTFGAAFLALSATKPD